MRAVSKHPDPGWNRPHRRRDAPLRLAGWVTAMAFAFPLAYLLWDTLWIEGGFLSRVASSDVAAPLGRSLLLATIVAVVSTWLGTGLAWLVVRTDIPAAGWWRAALALPLVIPSYVGAAGLRAAFGSGGLIPWVPRPSGFWGSLMVLSLLTYPYVYLPVAARLAATPASLEDAGRLLGDRAAAVVRRIVLPQVRPAVVAGSLIVFLYTLSDFGAVSLMRYDTITRAIYASRLADRSTALSLGLVLGTLAVAIALAERALAGRGAGAPTAETRPRMYRLGRLRRWSVGALVTVLLVALVAPLVVFVAWWLKGSLAAGSGYPGLARSLELLVEPARNSAMAGAAAGAAAMVLLLPAAYLAARRRRLVGSVTNVLIASTFALPGLVIALAMVYWVLRAPAPLSGLYQGYALLILVYVLHFGVQSQRASQTAVQALPAKLGEAARVLGASKSRRFFTVDLPIIAPGVLAGGGLVMLSTLKELPATLLLAPTGFDTLATRVWGAAEDGFLAEVGITSLVLVLLSAVLTWLLVLAPARSMGGGAA